MYSTWLPLAVVTAVNVPGRVDALVGEPEPVASKGGQVVAHPPVQAEVVAVSGLK